MDVELLKKTFVPYHQKLYRVAYRILKDKPSAEDAVQETYIKLWNTRYNMDKVDNIEAYAVMILKNTSLDFLRKKQNRTYTDYDKETAETNLLSSQIELKDELSLVRRLIDKLPDQQKQIFEMKHIDQYEMDEISEKTGLSLVNIRVILSRVRKRIREEFKKIEDGNIYN